MDQTVTEKEAVIAEYLVGETTYQKLRAKYGIGFRMIHSALPGPTNVKCI